jgi:hypothetical protein
MPTIEQDPSKQSIQPGTKVAEYNPHRLTTSGNNPDGTKKVESGISKYPKCQPDKTDIKKVKSPTTASTPTPGPIQEVPISGNQLAQSSNPPITIP